MSDSTIIDSSNKPSTGSAPDSSITSVSTGENRDTSRGSTPGVDSSEIRESVLDTGRLRMRILTAGDEDGPAVFLLHGFPEVAESWLEVMPALAAAGFHVVAPDLRGYGGTDAPKRGYELDSLAEDVAALAKALNRDRIGLVGHDWGGVVAFHTAAMKPHLIASLAVVNAPHPAVMAQRVWHLSQARRSWYMLFFQLPWIPELAITAQGGGTVARMLRSISVDRSRLTDERLAPHVRAFSSFDKARGPLAYYRAAFRSQLTRSGRQKLQDYPVIAAPFRLVWGTRDAALGMELTRDLDPWFEQPVEVRYLENVGHFAPMEAPHLVAPLLVEHLVPMLENVERPPPRN